jgi:hypothetical protein
MNKKYPVVKQSHDERDHLFVASMELSQLPKSVDLRHLCPPIYDQELKEAAQPTLEWHVTQS